MESRKKDKKMALFPSASAVKASFDPQGSRKTLPSNYWINSAVEVAPKKKIELYSSEFYLTCTLGGILGM